MDMELIEKKINITTRILKLISELEEFKGSFSSLSNLAPDKLNSLKKIATIESIGSSTRIEGVKLTNDEIKALLTGIEIKSFKNRDEQEVAGYSRLMNMIFNNYDEIKISENEKYKVQLPTYDKSGHFLFSKLDSAAPDLSPMHRALSYLQSCDAEPAVKDAALDPNLRDKPTPLPKDEDKNPVLIH